MCGPGRLEAFLTTSLLPPRPPADKEIRASAANAASSRPVSTGPVQRPATETAPSIRYVMAGVLMAAAMLCFVLLDIILKVLAREHSIGMLITVRNVLQMGLVALAAPMIGAALTRPRRPWLHLSRGLLLASTSALITLSLTFHSLAQSYAIALGAPIVASVLAVVILRERATPRSWACIMAGFAGVLVALSPTSMGFAWTLAFPLGMAIANGIFHVLTRLGRDEGPIMLVFWAAAMASLAGAATLPWTYEALPLGALAVLGVGSVIGTAGHLLMAQAFRLAPTAYVSPILYSQIVWGTLIGTLAFGEAVELHVLIGAAVVAASGVALATWASPRLARRTQPPTPPS